MKRRGKYAETSSTKPLARSEDLVVEELDDGLRLREVVVGGEVSDPAGPDPDRDRRLAAVHHRAPGPDQDVELRSHGRWSSRSG